MTETNKYTARAEEIERLEEEFSQKAKAIVMSSMTEFFADHPEAIEVAWEQYTPYFNDGEPCTFGAHDPYLKVDPAVLQKDVIAEIDEGTEAQEREEEDEDFADADNTLGYETCALHAIERNARHPRENLNKWNKDKRPMTDSEVTLVDDFRALGRVLTSVPRVLETAFGDHVRVSATRDGFTTHDYDHE